MTTIYHGFQDPDTASRGLDWIQKDPSDNADYERTWDARLAAGESISSVSWVVHDNDWVVLSAGADALEVGATTYAPSNTATAAKVWLSKGVVGTRYLVTCRVTTTASPARIMDESFQVRVIQR